jgi:integrase
MTPETYARSSEADTNPGEATKPKATPNRVKLTQLICERTRPPEQGATTIWDANLPGFGLRISAKGRRSWVAMYRVDGVLVMETIGTMSLIPSLADARTRARESMEKARRGIHPVHERKQQAAAEQAQAIADAFTLDKLIEDFIKKHHRQSRPGTIYEVRRLCRRALPYIGDKPVKQISKADVLGMVNDLSETRLHKWRGNDKGGSLSEASGVLRHLRTCFRWALDEDLVDKDPTQGVRDPSGGAKHERERVLSEDEIVALWQVVESLGYPWSGLIQLLILTGAREREIGDMPWSELDLRRRVWHLPSSRAKNHNAHDVPLSNLALEIINRIPRFVGEHDFLFSVTGTQPVTSYADCKVRIDKLMAEKLGNVEGWTYHDLRRSCASHMAAIGIQPHVLEACLNHKSGVVRGIAAVYNRYNYDTEKRAALDAWGRKVEELVYPERTQSNVVALAAE